MRKLSLQAGAKAGAQKASGSGFKLPKTFSDIVGAKPTKSKAKPLKGAVQGAKSGGAVEARAEQIRKEQTESIQLPKTFKEVAQDAL